MHALHPYGLQHWGYYAAAFIALANLTFGALYMYSLGIFNEGGGSYTASMRYLWPTLSLTVAVVLIQDYTLDDCCFCTIGGRPVAIYTGMVWKISGGSTLLWEPGWLQSPGFLQFGAAGNLLGSYLRCWDICPADTY